MQIVCILLFWQSARYIHIQTFCIPKWNSLGFYGMEHTLYVAVRWGLHFCQSPKAGGCGGGGGQEFCKINS